MNQSTVKMFSRKKAKPNNSKKEEHLWVILQKLSEHKPPSQVDQFFNQLSKQSIYIRFTADGERARKVVRRSNYRMTGKQPSPLNGRMMHWESHYEKKAFQLLEISPFVKAFREQPAVFEYQDADGVMKKHFPDIYVELVNGIKLFIEVKPDRAKDNQDLLDREALLKNYLSKKGFKYIQIYPEQIESLSYQENAQKMLWHVNSEPPYPVKEKIKQFISKEKKVPIEKLLCFVNDVNAKSWVFSLIVEGLIRCDLSIPLVSTTLLSLKGGE